MSDNLAKIRQLLPAVERYVRRVEWGHVSGFKKNSIVVKPLAQGEYNLNYLLTDGSQQAVLRVSMGTQIGRTDQIQYEYGALELLKDSGVTPVPYFVDDSRRHLEYGTLVMEYLPGGPLDYRRDSPAAAELLASIHQMEVPSSHRLIVEEKPLTLIYDECRGLLGQYLGSPLADPNIARYLADLLSWANTARHKEVYYQSDPWPCVINTEVNSGNFIVNRERQTMHLVDWEMPRWGDPSQDISHFCSPLTTLWKTTYRMPDGDRRQFIRHYQKALTDNHLRDTIRERIRLRDPFVRLRGIAWSAMGWVAYQTAFAGVKNPDTWATLRRYMQLEFIRELFDPIINSG